MTATHEPTPRKRAATNKPKVARKSRAKAAPPTLADSAVLVMLESADAAAAASVIDPAVRRQLVATEAYFIAQRRGFAAGHEFDDWIAAEAVVESKLRQMQAA